MWEAIVQAALGAAGGLAHLIKMGMEGEKPWDDPEAFMLGHARAELGGLGSVIRTAGGEPTIERQMRLADEAKEAGTGNILRRPIGQQTPEEGGGPTAPGATGVERYNTPDAVDSRGDIRERALKDIGIGLGTTALGFILPGVTQAIAPGVSAGASAGAGAASSLASTAAQAAPSFANVVAGASSTAAAAAPSALQVALETARSIPSVIGASARGLGQYTIQPVQSALVEAIGETPTSILGQTAFGAAKGAGAAALRGEDPLRGAASGGAGGLVSSSIGAGSDYLYPGSEASFVPTPRAMPSLLNGGSMGPNPFHMAMQQAGPTLGSRATSALAPTLGGFAGSAVSQAMTPQPPMPPEPMYQHRVSPLESYDIYGGLYGGNPYYRGM